MLYTEIGGRPSTSGDLETCGSKHKGDILVIRERNLPFQHSPGITDGNHEKCDLVSL
jgi:hypothetical protein